MNDRKETLADASPPRPEGKEPVTTAPFALPRTGCYALRRARVLGRSLPAPMGPFDFDGFALVDILVDEGAIAKIAPAGAVDFGDAPEVAMSGRIVLPLFVDVHTHIDKGHIWRRKRNPVGDFPSALAATIEDRSANWTAADVAQRMEFSLRSAYAYGTTALRTHIDSVGAQTRISWPVFGGSARALAQQDRAAGLAPFQHRACVGRLPHGRRRGDARRAWDRNPRGGHPHGPGAA